jgi:hypothetical protein
MLREGSESVGGRIIVLAAASEAETVERAHG